MVKRPTPPPLTKTERTHLDDLIRRGARALNPAEGNRLLRLLELDHADRAQERRTTGGLMGQVQALGGQLKDTTVRAEQAEAKLAAIRALAEQLATNGDCWGGNEPGVGEDLLEILDSPAEQQPAT